MLKKGFVFEIKIILSILVAVLIVVTIGILAYRSMSGIIYSISEEAKPDRKLTVLKNVLADLSDAESSVQAYTVTGDTIYLEPFYRSASTIDSRIDQLYELSKEHDQESQIDTLKSLIEQKFLILNEMLAIREDNRVSKTLERISARLAAVRRDNEIDRSSIISRIFRSRSASEMNADSTIVAVQQEISQIKKQEAKTSKAWIEKQLELTGKDKLVMDKIRIAVLSLEEQEQKFISAAADHARIKADRANLIIALFCIVVVGLLLVLGFFIIRYTRKSRAYAKALKKAKHEAENLARIKESFLSNMSHELRTPMNAITGFTEQLLNAPSLMNSEHREQIEIVRKSADHLVHILNDILDYSRLNAGKLELERTGFRVREVIDDIRSMLSHKAQEKNIQLICSVERSVPEILIGDTVRLKQILINIMGNAIKFTNRGHVKLNCIAVPQDEKSTRIQISVADTGIGIPPEKIKSIFKEFEQADASTTRKYGGTGLGLTITRKLLEVMNGSIQINSEYKKGTIITFNIPFAIGKESDIVVKEQYQFNHDKLKDVSVLVADDEEYNRKLLVTILQKWDIDYTEVSNGQEAIEQLEHHNYDLVLMDLQMPVLNGIQATQQLRSLQIENKDLPVLALTAAVSNEIETKCLEAGMNGILNKPFKEKELYDKICMLLHIEEPELQLVHEGDAAPNDPVFHSYDLSEIRTLSNGDDNFIEDMLQLFIKTTQEGIAAIQHGVKTGTWSEVGHYSHKLAAPCKHLGAQKLFEMLKTMEAHAAKGSSEQMYSLLEQIEDEVDGLMKFLKSELKRMQ